MTPVNHATFVLERTFNAAPARIFAAFADPAAKRRWFFDTESATTEHYALDFRVGGAESWRGTMAGERFANETRFLDIVDDARIVFAYTMACGEKRFSVSLSTVELHAEGAKTRLVFTEQAAYFEDADGPQMRKQGWTHLLDALAAHLGE